MSPMVAEYCLVGLLNQNEEKRSLLWLENRCLKIKKTRAMQERIEGKRGGWRKKTDPVRCLRLKRGSSALRGLGRDSHPRDPGWGPEDVCAHHGCRPAALHTWFPILPASRRLLSTWWSAPLLLQRQRERERGGQKGREGESERGRERER